VADERRHDPSWADPIEPPTPRTEGDQRMTAASRPGPTEREPNRDRDRDRDREPAREASREPNRERERERDVERRPERPAAASPARPWGAIVAALVVGLLLGGGAAWVLADRQGGDADPFAGVVDTTRFQAVILSNDKVYFGQVENVSDEYVRLDRAFFLRETRENADAEPVRALLPVNREIHAPDNTMLIRKDQVVLVENLAKDSPILTEIRRQLGDK
jgi:hypothetical protein